MTTDHQTAIDMGYDDEGSIDEFARIQAMEDEEFAAHVGIDPARAELLELGDACDVEIGDDSDDMREIDDACGEFDYID